MTSEIFYRDLKAIILGGLCASSLAATSMTADVGQTLQLGSPHEYHVAQGRVESNTYYKILGARLIDFDTKVEITMEQFFTPLDRLDQIRLNHPPETIRIIVENGPSLSDVPGINVSGAKGTENKCVR